MARRRGAFAPRRQGPRRQSEWIASADQNAVVALGASVVLLNQSLTAATFVAAGLAPSTIVRTRGSLYVHSDQTAANESGFGAFGMAVVNDNARAAGAASLPGPITDEGFDSWFVYENFGGMNFGPSTGALFANPWTRYDFDSKAMRKVENGDAVVVMFENASLAAGLEFIIKFRMLFKTH